MLNSKQYFSLFLVAFNLLIQLHAQTVDQKYVTECSNELKVDLFKLQQNWQIKEPDEEIRCFIKCIMEKKRMMSKDGTFDEDMFLINFAKFNYDDVKNWYKECKVEAEREATGKTECVKGQVFFYCAATRAKLIPQPVPQNV